MDDKTTAPVAYVIFCFFIIIIGLAGIGLIADGLFEASVVLPQNWDFQKAVTLVQLDLLLEGLICLIVAGLAFLYLYHAIWPLL